MDDDGPAHVASMIFLFCFWDLQELWKTTEDKEEVVLGSDRWDGSTTLGDRRIAFGRFLD